MNKNGQNDQINFKIGKNTSPEKKKQALMKVAVISLALIIFLFWIYNLKNVWTGSSYENSDLESIKQVFQVDTEQALSENKQESDADKLLQDIADNAGEKINQEIKQEDKNIKNNDVCPAWINCMPSIDEARSCQIPPGCEDITQIAY